MRRTLFIVCLSSLSACGAGRFGEEADSSRPPSDGGGAVDAPATDVPEARDSSSEPDVTTADTPTADTSSIDLGDADDRDLADAINRYRVSQGLSAIPLSPSLSEVARAHVADLRDNGAESGSCNLHSWSDAGEWSACCYTADHAQASCMWSKPRELTIYPGSGYEISASGVRSPEHALSQWQSSPAHHDVILNRGIWDEPWLAMGAAIEVGGFSHVWFGREVDPAAP